MTQLAPGLEKYCAERFKMVGAAYLWSVCRQYQLLMEDYAMRLREKHELGYAADIPVVLAEMEKVNLHVERVLNKLCAATTGAKKAEDLAYFAESLDGLHPDWQFLSTRVENTRREEINKLVGTQHPTYADAIEGLWNAIDWEYWAAQIEAEK
jgi:hypothetical protein